MTGRDLVVALVVGLTCGLVIPERWPALLVTVTIMAVYLAVRRVAR